MERTAHDPIPGAPCKPSKIKALRRFDSTFRIRFRVGAVMTASILLHHARTDVYYSMLRCAWQAERATKPGLQKSDEARATKERQSPGYQKRVTMSLLMVNATDQDGPNEP